MTSTLRCGAIGRFWPYRTGAMHNVVYELRRISLPRTRVNKGERKSRDVLAPALKQLNALCLSACVVDGLDAFALVLEAEFLVAALFAVSLRLRSSARRDES